MAVIESEDYKIVNFECPKCLRFYPFVKIGIGNPNRISGSPYPPYIFTNKCCGRYYLENGTDITEKLLHDNATLSMRTSKELRREGKMSKIAEDQKIVSDKHNLMIQITDYLFDKGYAVSRPMMADIADFIYDLKKAVYEQGKNIGRESAKKDSIQ